MAWPMLHDDVGIIVLESSAFDTCSKVENWKEKKRKKKKHWTFHSGKKQCFSFSVVYSQDSYYRSTFEISYAGHFVMFPYTS